MLSRREFLAAVPMAASALAQTAKRPPNLLYICIDQLSGLALPGLDANARMPHTAALAKSGVTFTHAYTAAMTCGPSRASLDTGLHTKMHGVGGGTRPDLTKLDSLPARLAAAGYATTHPHGYNLEDERKEHEKWLIDLGYEQPLSSLYGVERMAKYLDFPLKWKCGRTGLAPEHAFDAYCAHGAIRFLESNREKPFACFLQLRGPHDPYMTPRPFDTLVDPASLALPAYRAGEFADKAARQRSSFETQGASKMSDAQIRQMLALYYGMAAFSDHCAGKVLDRLRELKLDDNTVVVLLADHGDTMGRHRMFSKDFAFYEPAMRIPMIIRAPGRKGGVVCPDPVSGVDVFPTLCELLSFEKPKEIAGQSLVGRWEGRGGEAKRTIFASQGAAGRNRAVMLRTPRYKFTHYDDGGDGELYDLERDPNELTNLIADPKEATTVERLTRELKAWEAQPNG